MKKMFCNISFNFGALMVFLIATPVSHGQETLYPEGYDIPVIYSTPTLITVPGESITITRIIDNREFFDLGNLYISDYLPPELNIESYSATIDGLDISIQYSGAIENEAFPGYWGHQWLIDEPSVDDTMNRVLASGEILQIQYSLLCNSPGLYLLPFHTVCFYGNNNGFFTLSDSKSLAVLNDRNCGDADGDNGLNILDIVYIINFKYKGGPPPAQLNYVDVDGSGRIDILDVIYLINFIYKGGAIPNCP